MSGITGNTMEAKRAPGFEGQAGSGHGEAEEGRGSWGMGTENAEWEFFFNRPGRAARGSRTGE